MKRIVVLLIVSVLLVAITACDSGNGEYVLAKRHLIIVLVSLYSSISMSMMKTEML